MKTSQDTTTGSMDEIEDLTLFADETFDTEEVDLFEFTGEDDSPLTRLKSIILSLDWEINDDILQELADEIANLQHMWQGDKVAQVYLQGLEKIGQYLKLEGAYAHPNAIKLLLTFYYDFEKIISSESITGNEITALLKNDVRKFKILQYQINQSKGRPTMAETGEGETEETVPADTKSSGEQEIECEPLTCLKATILGLEWEVTDKGLDQFNAQIAEVREHFMDNRSAQILIQGLQALGGYITDERAEAHPEAFNLLHSFYEGLERLLDEENLSSEEKQELLVDRVNRLNALKALLAEQESGSTASVSVSDAIVDEVLEGTEENLVAATEEEEPGPAGQEDQPAPADDSADAPAAVSQAEKAPAAMETAETAYPDELLDPDAIQPVEDHVADDFIEEELNISTDIAAALDHTEEEPAPAETETDSGLEEELDLFFSEGDSGEQESEPLHVEEPVSGAEDDAEELELSFSDDDFDSGLSEEGMALADALSVDDEEEKETAFSPALADSDEEGGFNEEIVLQDIEEEPAAEIDDKLDAFFGLDEDEQEETPATVAEDLPADDETGTQTEEPIAPALADADEEGGFREEEAVQELTEEPVAEVDDKLDAFFVDDEGTETKPMPTETTAPSLQGLIERLRAMEADSDLLREENDLLTGLTDQDEELTGEQRALLQLVRSAREMAAEAAVLPEDTGKFMGSLARDLEQEQVTSNSLVSAIARFTSWQQELLRINLASPSISTQAPDTGSEEPSQQESPLIDTIRALIKEEFNTLRQELQSRDS